MASELHRARNFWIGLLALSCLAPGGWAASAAEPVTLRGRVIDRASGEPLAARIYIRSDKGEWYFPKSAAPEGSAIEYRRERSAQSLEMHTTLSAHPFTVALPAGEYTVVVERGKEYLPREERLVVGKEEAELSVGLSLHRPAERFRR